MSKTSIIMDVDTGVDDAFAVLFAAMHPDINLLGITCVDGNTNVDQVVANTFKVLDAAGAGDIPCLLYTSPSPRDLSTSRCGTGRTVSYTHLTLPTKA